MIKLLNDREIEFVSGGFYEADRIDDFIDWAKSKWDRFWKDDLPNGNQHELPSLTGAELGQMQRDCVAAGMNFRMTQTSSSAGATVKVVGANGATSYFSVSCTKR